MTCMNGGRTIEFKREYTEDIKKTIAFTNSDGGIIYIGIHYIQRVTKVFFRVDWK